MGTKGMPFGYLEFSRAFEGNHTNTRESLPAGARVRVRVRVQPGPLLFEPDHTGAKASLGCRSTRSAARIHDDWTEPLQRCRQEQLQRFKQEPSQPFPLYSTIPAVL